MWPHHWGNSAAANIWCTAIIVRVNLLAGVKQFVIASSRRIINNETADARFEANNLTAQVMQGSYLEKKMRQVIMLVVTTQLAKR